MPVTRRVFIVGGRISKFLGRGSPDFIDKKHPLFGKKDNPTLKDYIAESVNGALSDTGVSAEVVEKCWMGNFAGELYSSQGHLGAAFAGANPALIFKPSMRVEGACASGGLAFASAVTAVQAGMDIGLVAGAEMQTTVSARQGGDYLARAADYERQRPIDDFTFPALFASRVKAYMASYNLTFKDLAPTPVKAYANGNLNPLAHMYAKKVSLDEAIASPGFLGNPDLKDHLPLIHCSQVSDGAAALVVASEEGLKKLGKSISDCVEVVINDYAAGDLYSDGDPLELSTVKASATRAYKAAGLTPEQMEVAEVHDCFAIAEILMCEALGFAPKGKGYTLAADGTTAINGRIPVNTGGGLLSFGHPVGATGVKQLLEVYRQMKGQCGNYQMAKRPTYGICANMGGDDKTAVVTILKNCV